MRSDVKTGSPAPDRISNRSPLKSLPAALRAVIGHDGLAPQRQAGFLDNGFRCAVSAPTPVDVSINADTNVAWLLGDAADVCLTGRERMMTFVELGCGESDLAIRRILNVVLSSRMTLSVAILDRLTRWLDGYVGTPEEPR